MTATNKSTVIIKGLCSNKTEEDIFSKWPSCDCASPATRWTFPEIDDIFWLTTLTKFVVIIFFLYVIYKLCKPMNWKKDLSEVGYNQHYDTPDLLSKHNRRRDVVRQIQRTRKVGERVPPPFPNGWFGILESSQLTVNQVRSVDCLGENFAVFRTGDGVAHILDAYCPHLGANMGVGGHVRGNCLECPFHQWTFSAEDGHCTNAPYSTTVPKTARVKKWRCTEVDGCIFVWYHAEGEEPWTLPSIPEVTNNQWIYRGRNEFIVNCHIQDIPENGADTVHLDTIHGPNLFGGSDLRYFRHFWAAFGLHCWQASWQPKTDEPHIAQLEMEHCVKMFGKYELLSMKVTANQVGPAYVQLIVHTRWGPLVILQTVTPIEPLLQRVVHRVYCPPLLSLYASFTMWGETIMFERDIMIWNHKKYIDSPHYLREDKNIKRCRKWYEQFYTASSKEFTFARESMDW